MTLLPMENREGILCALKCFGKEKPNNIPPILEDYIKQIARCHGFISSHFCFISTIRWLTVS
ncbi:hypothetical protein PHET_12407 [Paragonimus heterotremus]|uniref:Uncharacterized protein n=1 Tax=Paragonimus heterotremus TaxID=100268 RepID=A0A8J4SKK6_9TREM|nr:hypothetical protein PHET_12407 [Paragonimus heterotremus]